MPVALDPQERFDFILEAERALPSEQQTVFVLRTLTWGETTTVRRMYQQGKTDADAQDFVLRAALLGWSNFRDASGRTIEFELDKGKPSPKNLDRVDGITWGMELFNEVWKRTHLTEAERKNS